MVVIYFNVYYNSNGTLAAVIQLKAKYRSYTPATFLLCFFPLLFCKDCSNKRRICFKNLLSFISSGF